MVISRDADNGFLALITFSAKFTDTDTDTGNLHTPNSYLVNYCLPTCGWDKSSDPISTFLKQEVHFQNIDHMANGCQQPGFHSFYHGKT